MQATDTRQTSHKGMIADVACVTITVAMVGADFGYLKVAATKAIAARDVLRNSYIAGFSLAWGDRRRSGPFHVFVPWPRT